MKEYPRHCGLRMSNTCCLSLVQDRTSGGLRDYAILLLLASYGLRAGERLPPCGLKTSTGSGTFFTCDTRKREPTRACRYCRTLAKRSSRTSKGGRPQPGLREVFLWLPALLRPFRDGSALYGTIRNRLRAAGVMPVGKRGPHAFRHA